LLAADGLLSTSVGPCCRCDVEDRFPGVRSVARDIPISEHSRVGIVVGHID